MITWDDEHVHALLKEEFENVGAQVEGTFKATVSEQGENFGIEMRLRPADMDQEICAFPTMKKDGITDDKIREMIAEGLRVIAELYQEKAVKQ